MNRKLSITSAVSAEGNHVRANEKVLEEMNRDDTDDDKSNLNNEKEVNTAKTPAIVQEASCPSSGGDEENHGFNTVLRIYSSLCKQDQEALRIFILNAIAHHTRRKTEEHIEYCTSTLNLSNG